MNNSSPVNLKTLRKWSNSLKKHLKNILTKLTKEEIENLNSIKEIKILIKCLLAKKILDPTNIIAVNF